MFVSIDMDNLVFLHKHHDHEAISAASWLECGQQVSIRVEPYHDASAFLVGVSDLDVRMLYKNTTGQPLPKDTDAAALRYQLKAAVELMPSTRILVDEVVAQAEAVDDRLYAGERFRYALGARLPAQPAELLPLRGRSLTDRELAEAHARSRNPVRGYPPRLSGEVAKPWDPEPAQPSEPLDTPAPVVDQPTPTALPERRAKAPQGSAKPVIWAAARDAWASRNLGETWEVVRKRVIATLEADNLHPTTIRIKLAQWAKEQPGLI